MGKESGGMSHELDQLSSTLLGDALDMLAAGQDLGVLIVVEDASGHDSSWELVGDATDVSLNEARQQVSQLGLYGDKDSGLGQVARYALAYEGAVDAGDGTFADAVLLEFGERGCKAYSAYTFYEGKGAGEEFRWSEPAPAGEMASLL